jgi:hypothetical protein
MIGKIIRFGVPFMAMWLMVADMAYGVEKVSEISNYSNNIISLFLTIVVFVEVFFLIFGKGRLNQF